MNYSTQNYSLSDLAAVTGRNNNGADGIFGGGGGLIALIALFLLFSRFGWGGFGGWGDMGGGYGGGSGGVANNYVLASDFGQIDRKLDGISNGICDATYALNNGIQNGFAAAQSTMCQGFSGINDVVTRNGYEGRIATNAVGTQMQQCCCDVRSDLAGINYNVANQSAAIQNVANNGFCQLSRGMEKGFSDVSYGAATNTTAIIQSQHSDADRIIARIDAFENAQKDAEMAKKDQRIFQLELKASQEAQNNYLVSKLGYQCPTASYMVPNPNGPLNYSVNYGCGCAA